MAAPNNRFGIHISDENDFPDAANLVNSGGGEWGYVTFVIRQDEREPERWKKAFNDLKSQKLIPIVRIATFNQDGIWSKPKEEDAKKWASFLDSLPWPTKNRYVILFNEPNHTKEWGGEINPAEYASLARTYWEQLKRASADFFVLPAALDASAPNSSYTMEESTFLGKMFNQDELIFTIFDGWNSHSYPNPRFCGSPDDNGKGSIRTYSWEVNFLEKYYLLSDTPIFITETGWACKKNLLSSFYEKAFREAWNDPRIVSVTPFILSYSRKPFDIFSWKNAKTGKFLSHYDSIRSLPKIKGEPEIPQENKTKFAEALLPNN